MKGFDGRSLPHFTPRPSPESSGVNVLAQNLPGEVAFLDSPYVVVGSFRLIPKEILVASDPEVLY